MTTGDAEDGNSLRHYESLTTALNIIRAARQTVLTSPAAWSYLQRVTDHLTTQQSEAFMTVIGADGTYRGADGHGIEPTVRGEEN